MRRIVQPPAAGHFETEYAPAGDAVFILKIGDLAIRLRGLPTALRDSLVTRFDKFWSATFDGGLDVEVCAADRDYYIDPPQVSEIEPGSRGLRRRACALYRVSSGGYFDTVGERGKVLLAHGELEPADRAIENYLRAAVAWRAAERGGALVHAAGAVWDGKGYFFYGESGAGKSTLSECNRRAKIVSDDLSLILPGLTGLELIGSPFRGTYEGGERIVGRFPVVAGFRLIQDREARVEPVERIRALSELIGNLPFVAEGFVQRPDLFAKIERSFESIRLMHLHFRKDDSYWDAIREAGL